MTKPRDRAGETGFDVHVLKLYSVVEFERNPYWCVSREAYYNQKGYLLAYCYAGHAFYTLDNETFEMREGDLLFIRRDVHRAGTTDPEDPWGFIVAAFELQADVPEDKALLQSLTGYMYMSRDIFPLFRELYHIWLTKRTGYMLRARNLVERILMEVLAQSQSEKPSNESFSAIERAVFLMECNPQRTFYPAELAARCHFSEGYFRQQFKKYTGMSVMNYQNFLRVNRAKEYLIYGDYNVSQTAQALGFSSSFYFCRVFKKLTGLSPSEYKKSCKE